ncbi:MAG: MarR family winged helix-turn-helix transcriptional regulator [Alphaproteobacteria bacterium]
MLRERNGVPVGGAGGAPNGARLELESFVPFRLSVLSNRISSAIAQQYTERFGLTMPEWRVMAVLGAAPGLSARDIAERTGMDKVQVSRAVAQLVKRKRVARKADAADRRMHRLALTSKGEAIYAEIVPLARDLEAKFLAALEPSDRATLLRLLTALSIRSEVLA